MGRDVPWRARLLWAGGVLLVAAAGSSGRLDLTSSEITAVVTVLVGLVIALGVFEPRRPATGAATTRPADRCVVTSVERTLDALDPIAHRRLDLGTNWPQLLVGPSGVAVVAVCPLDGPLEVRSGSVFEATTGSSCMGCAESADVAAVVREALGTSDVPVRRLAVVPAGVTVSGELPSSADDIVVVSASQLADALARGPVLSMDSVDAVFTRLARSVTADPRLLSSG